MEYITEYCKTGNTINLRKKISPEIKNTILKTIPHTLKKYKDENNIFKNRALEMLDILSSPIFEENKKCIEKIKGLEWTGNSCYLDSVLICIFAIQNDFIDEYILNSKLKKRYGTLLDCFETKKLDDDKKSKIDLENRKNIQNELKIIYKNIKNGKKQDCSELRKELKKCKSAQLFSGSRMAESGEFLTYIFSIFDMNVATKKTVTYGTNNIKDINPDNKNLIKTSEIMDTKASVIHFIPSDIIRLLDDKYYEIRSFLTIKDDSGELDIDNQYKDDNDNKYKRRISYNNLVDTPYLVFRIDRLWNRKFLKTKIIPSQIITLQNLKQFALSSVIVFNCLHYTCYFRCGNKWYYYNDIDNDIVLIGNYVSLLKTKSYPNVITNGTVYFYTKM